MSGGHYNYIYSKIEDVSYQIEDQESNALRKVFAEHLRKLAIVMQAIEWVDSGDSSPGSEDELIIKLLYKDE